MRTKNAIVLTMTLLIAALIMPINYVNASTDGISEKQQTVNIESVFEDLYFRKYVQNNFDIDSDGELSTEEIAKVTVLDISGELGIASLAGIEVFAYLQVLDCSYLNLDSIDLSALVNLETLLVENNRLSSIDLSQNTGLKVLNCSDNPLLSLDLASLTALENLICDNTEIKEIDLSSNINLKDISIDGSDLESLDLSKNSVLSKLSISNTTLGYLTLPQSGSMTQINGTARQDIVYLADHDSFKITDIFPGIDVSKIEDMSGADISGDTVSGYAADYAIVYRYNAGKLNGQDYYLAYRIDLMINNYWKEELSISDIQYGDKLTPQAQAMYGTVEFLWSDSEDGEYTAEKPADVGTYYCKAIIKGNSDFTGLVSDAKEFHITQAQNSWIIEPSIEDADYETLLNMSGKAKFGEVKFVFASSIDGPYDDELPIEAGQYYAKAIVDATTNYQGLESSPISFKINEAVNYWLQELTIDDWIYGEEAAKPQAISRYGNVSFSYSQDKDGMYSALPSDPDAGIWYVKAVATGSYSYNGLVSEPVAFEIHKAQSNITIDEISLDKVYDGIAINDPSYRIEGSSGSVDVRYEVWKNDNWSSIDSAPSLPGKYRVIIALTEDKNHLDALSTMEFIISKLSNDWTVEPAIRDVVYGEELITEGEALHGEIKFVFAKNANGIYEESIPSAAGLWYAKAVVVADDIYEGISKTFTFKIKKAIPFYELPSDLVAAYDDQLNDIVLPSGFIWHEPTRTIDDIGQLSFAAYYVPEDNANYQIVENIMIDVMVDKAVNKLLAFDVSEMVYGDSFDKIKALSRFGKTEILFGRTKEGSFTTDRPDAAGIWYVKAIVKGNDYYAGLESEAYPLVIKPRTLDQNDVKISGFTLADLDGLTIRYNGQLLVTDQDYEVVKKAVDVGFIVDIIFKNNYQGVISKTFVVQTETSGSANENFMENDQIAEDLKDETGFVQDDTPENSEIEDETEQSGNSSSQNQNVNETIAGDNYLWIAITIGAALVLSAIAFVFKKIRK